MRRKRSMQGRECLWVDIQLYEAGAAHASQPLQDVGCAVRKVEAIDGEAAAVAQFKGLM